MQEQEANKLSGTPPSYINTYILDFYNGTQWDFDLEQTTRSGNLILTLRNSFVLNHTTGSNQVTVPVQNPSSTPYFTYDACTKNVTFPNYATLSLVLDTPQYYRFEQLTDDELTTLPTDRALVQLDVNEHFNSGYYCTMTYDTSTSKATCSSSSTFRSMPVSVWNGDGTLSPKDEELKKQEELDKQEELKKEEAKREEEAMKEVAVKQEEGK